MWEIDGLNRAALLECGKSTEIGAINSLISKLECNSTSSASPEFPVADGEFGFVDLPEELVVNIAEYLLELDLSRLSQTCRRFARICNDSELWRNLYTHLFQYDRPLTLSDKDRKFVFTDIDDRSQAERRGGGGYGRAGGGDGAMDANEEDFRCNPWRESFKTLYRGMHVRPGCKRMYNDKPALLLKPTRPPATIQSAPMPGHKTAFESGGAAHCSATVDGAPSSGAVPKAAPNCDVTGAAHCSATVDGAPSSGAVPKAAPNCGVTTEVAPVATSTTIRRPGRRVTHFETLSAAIDSIQGTWKRYLSILSRSKGAKVPLIFVHAGKYVEDFPDIICDLMIIGAAGSGSDSSGIGGGIGGGGCGGGRGSGRGGGGDGGAAEKEEEEMEEEEEMDVDRSPKEFGIK